MSGTAEARMPAAAAQPSAAAVGGCRIRVVMPIGTKTSADKLAAAADPWVPGIRSPICRLSRM